MVKQQHIVDAISRLKYIKRQGKFSEEHDNKLNRLDYIQAEGKYAYKSREFKGGRASHYNYSYLFKCLENQFSRGKKINYENKQSKRYRRIARELIIPIPHVLKANVQKQYEFIDIYIEKFKSKYGLGNEFLYLYGIHNKESEGKKLNLHAHFIFSERPLLINPKHIKTKTRYYDSNNRECKKEKAVRSVKSKNKIIYFGNKYTNENIKGKNKQLFHSYEFCKEQDSIWKDVVLEMGIMKEEQLINVFKSSFSKHFPNHKRGNVKQRAYFNHSISKERGLFIKRAISAISSAPDYSFNSYKAWHEEEEKDELEKKKRERDEGR